MLFLVKKKKKKFKHKVLQLSKLLYSLIILIKLKIFKQQTNQLISVVRGDQFENGALT